MLPTRWNTPACRKRDVKSAATLKSAGLNPHSSRAALKESAPRLARSANTATLTRRSAHVTTGVLVVGVSSPMGIIVLPLSGGGRPFIEFRAV